MKYAIVLMLIFCSCGATAQVRKPVIAKADTLVSRMGFVSDLKTRRQAFVDYANGVIKSYDMTIEIYENQISGDSVLVKREMFQKK